MKSGSEGYYPGVHRCAVGQIKDSQHGKAMGDIMVLGVECLLDSVMLTDCYGRSPVTLKLRIPTRKRKQYFFVGLLGIKKEKNAEYLVQFLRLN